MTTENNNHQTLDQVAGQVHERFMQMMSEQLRINLNSLDKIHQASIKQQELAADSLVLRVIVRQRLQLMYDIESAKTCPIIANVLSAQAADLDRQIVDAMVDMGVPVKAAKEHVLLKFSTAKEELEVVSREDNGRIKSITKQGA